MGTSPDGSVTDTCEQQLHNQGLVEIKCHARAEKLANIILVVSNDLSWHGQITIIT